MAGKNLKLRFLCLIHRHGDRAPNKFLPNDPNVERWPDGLSNLTKRGQVEMYNLGRTLRKRYDDFLGDKNLTRDVYVRSTDFARCLISAQCCLAGLYPPVDDEDKVAPGLNWQPVAVHTMPTNIDPLVLRFPNKYRHPESGTYEDPEHDQLYQTMTKYQELWDCVDDISKSNGHFKQILLALDGILIEAKNKLAIPEQLEGRLEELQSLFTATCLLHCIKHIEALESAGALLEEIARKMDKFADDSSSVPKTLIYSLHDMNIISTIAIVAEQYVECPTGSCLIFELLEDVDASGDDGFYVKMLFLTKLDGPPQELKFSGREETVVSLVDFYSFVANYVQKTKEQNGVGHVRSSIASCNLI